LRNADTTILRAKLRETTRDAHGACRSPAKATRASLHLRVDEAFGFGAQRMKAHDVRLARRRDLRPSAGRSISSVD
jgi:hypothetical protein